MQDTYHIPEVSGLPLRPARLTRNPSKDAWDFRQRVRESRLGSPDALAALAAALQQHKTDVLTDGRHFYTIAGGYIALLEVRDLLAKEAPAAAPLPPAPEGFPPELLTLPVLSIRGPWWYFILHADKRHENRSWPDWYRDRELAKLKASNGRFLIHASKLGKEPKHREEFDDACCFAEDRGVANMPSFDSIQNGGIVGQATFVQWVTRANSDWFVGPGALEIKDTNPLPFYACKGALGFFFLA